MTLNGEQQRVLGALMEKEMTTPEGYPLSLNALLNACNQRSSRDPVMELEEEQVRQALHGLEEHGLTTPVRDSRVPKYEHRARTVLNLRRDETAILCLLLLRGPQTPGELRSRADRMFSFDDISAVQSALNRLATRAPRNETAAGKLPQFDGPLVAMLARLPGSRESRYAQLLGGPAEAEPVSFRSIRSAGAPPPDPEQLAALEAQLAAMRTRLDEVELRLTKVESPQRSSQEAEELPNTE